MRFAHQTIRQDLFPDSPSERSDSLVCELQQAQLFVGSMCLTYLCFSDFDTQIEVRKPEVKVERPLDPLSGAAYWLPNLLGVRNSLFDLPYRLLSGHTLTSSPSIDYAKYLRPASVTNDTAASQALLEKYGLLDYVIKFWMYYTSHFGSTVPDLCQKLRDVTKTKTLAFEFRPWGPNQHFGSYVCVSCDHAAGSKLSVNRLPYMSMLHYAAKFAHWVLMEDLLHEYCLHEAPNQETLLLACRHGHVGVVMELTSRPMLSRFYKAIDDAVKAGAASGSIEMVVYLIEVSNHGHYSVQLLGHEPLIIASGRGYETIVNYLLRNGARVDKMTVTALYAAASNGHDHIVRSLLAERAIILGSRTSPLHGACEYGHEVVIRTLLKADARADTRDTPPNVLSPPHLVGALDQEGETPLHKAARAGHHAAIKVMLELAPMTRKWVSARTHWGSDEKTAYKQGAIHLAASKGHLDVLEVLAGFTFIEARTSRQETPLHLAAAQGHVSIIQWLKRVGASTRMLDEMGYSPLQTAITKGREEAVAELLSPADCDMQGVTGLLVLAARKGQKDVVAFLLEHCGRESLLKNGEFRRAGCLRLAIRDALFAKQHDAKLLLEGILAQHLRERGMDD